MSYLEEFQQFVEVVTKLRDPQNGCPWDLEQNLDSLKKYSVEEVYEYIDAVESKKAEDIKEELGDVLLQVVLNSVVAEQEKLFKLEQVIKGIKNKMIHRHPHVFSKAKANSSAFVEKNWDNIKSQEKEKDFFDFPKHLPALSQSYKIGKKSKKIRFDWPNKLEVWQKVEEEIAELKEAEKIGDPNKILEELGDVLFTIAQYSRHLNIEPEEALRASNKKFKERFQKMEELLKKENKNIDLLNTEDWESLWQQAKKQTQA